MTRALGALLRFLDKHGAELLDGTTLLGGTPILGVQYYCMDELAQLDDATVAALQLFSEDQHPSAFKSGKTSSSKEGLSIYALLSRTASPMAAHTLRRVLLRPVLDAEVLEARYAAVEWGVDTANMETLRHLHACLKSIRNVPHTMNRLQRGQLNVRDWRTLYKSLFNAILVGEICQAQDQDIPIFKEHTPHHTPSSFSIPLLHLLLPLPPPPNSTFLSPQLPS
ncbi:putative mutS protein-like 5-like [Penaeus vannamei]|uniref:Putative mutS protein-like 5-like n=1 Tax=Penaeus vannamei TaxID=6689 RepID=A0A423TZW3_PENVA|nr:putative mutS protein-like 5-like [Penaeus vannamei]